MRPVDSDVSKGGRNEVRGRLKNNVMNGHWPRIGSSPVKVRCGPIIRPRLHNHCGTSRGGPSFEEIEFVMLGQLWVCWMAAENMVSGSTALILEPGFEALNGNRSDRELWDSGM